jgi:chromosome segregation protein
MKLQKLILNGFKSFPNKTEFNFADGITAIVGPNGCGKSNIVDAFKWVLGSQSAKSLRGKLMMDVLFNGSAARRSVGFAEVSIAFDNEDGRMPVEHSSVMLTRRLYRSGESEYLINDQTCRLRDIKELFLDTGVGMGAYSLIEQGRIGTFLEANAVEKRQIFEEAAGISKYNVRKREAARKLERTEQNLLRLGDVIRELERRCRSIKAQAAKARNYQDYMSQLRELRSRHSLAQMRELSTQIGELEIRLSDSRARAAEIRNQIGASEAERRNLQLELARVDEQLNLATIELTEGRASIEANSESVVAQNRRTIEFQNQLDSARERALLEARKAKDAENRLMERKEAAARAADEVEQCHKTITRLQERLNAVNESISQTQAEWETAKASIIELERRSAAANNEIASCDLQRNSVEKQAARVQHEYGEIRGQIRTHHEQVRGLEQRIGARTDSLSELRRQMADAKDGAEALDRQIAERTARLGELRERRSACESRRHLLEEMERQNQGLGAGVREALRRRDEDPDRYGFLRGIVADVFEARKDSISIIQAALGPFEQHLIVSDSARLMESGLLDELPGRVELICLDRLPPLRIRPPYSSGKAAESLAIDLVRFPDDCRPLAMMLLGTTVVVDSLDLGIRLDSTNAAGYRFVTPVGELLEPEGTIHCGPLGGQGQLISRRSELKELEEELSLLDSEIQQLRVTQERASLESAAIEEQQRRLADEANEANTELVASRTAAMNLQEQIRRLEERQPILESERNAFQQQLDEIRDRREFAQSELEQAETDGENQRDEAETIRLKLREFSEQARQISEQIQESKVASAKLVEKQGAALQAVSELERVVREAVSARQSADMDADQARRGIDRETLELLGRQSRIADSYVQIERIQKSIAEFRRRRDQGRSRANELTEAVTSLRTDLEASDGESHRSEVELNERRIRREELIHRVSEELGVDLEAAFREYEHEEQDWNALADRIQNLRQKIERIGNVNVDAISEQEELEERLNFLSEKRDDIVKGQKNLEDLIATLNRESRDRFVETFSQVRENFQELFRKLFGGGRADVVLENPDDVLESGIEIVARPPGKELRTINLLSGGEKALTAIALMLGVFKCRPSPICVLDEVDAPLDEANNERFNQIIKEFVASSQFIVITHSKRTMSVAAALYGITMQEAGVSTQVSVKFDDESPTAATAVA